MHGRDLTKAPMICVVLALLLGVVVTTFTSSNVTAVSPGGGAEVLRDDFVEGSFAWAFVGDTTSTQANDTSGQLNLIELDAGDGVVRTFDTDGLGLNGQRGAVLINLNSVGTHKTSVANISVKNAAGEEIGFAAVKPAEYRAYGIPISVPFNYPETDITVSITAENQWVIGDALRFDDFQLVTKSNPDLAPTCGMDVSVVLDESRSIRTQNAIGKVETGVKDLIKGLQGTNSQIRFSEFDTTGSAVKLGEWSAGVWRPVDDTLVTDVGTYLDSTTTLSNASYQPPRSDRNIIGPEEEAAGATNWESGFAPLIADPIGSERPDLVLFITDGVPTKWTTDSGDTAGNGEFLELHAILEAQDEVDTLQNAGVHVLGVGVGGASTAEGLNRIGQLLDPADFKTVTGADADVDMRTVDVYNAGDFDNLAASLHSIAYSLCPLPQISVAKTANGNTATFLGNNTYQMGYTITVDSTGDRSGEYDLVDTPDFGAGTTITGIKVDGTPVAFDPTTGSFTLATDQLIGVDEVHTYLVDVTFKVPGILTATEAVCQSGNGGAGSGTFNSVTVTSETGSQTDNACGNIPQLDLQIQKTDNGATGSPGGPPFDYVITVTNVSSRNADPAEPVTVTDQLPVGLSWTTVPAGCSTAGQKMTCGLDPARLTAGASVKITASVAADASTKAGNYTNVVWVDTPDDPQCVAGSCPAPPPCPTGNVAPSTGAPTPVNNVACESTPIDSPEADVAILKSSNIDNVPLNGEFTWILDVENLGPAVAEDVVVTDPLPDDVSFVSVSSEVFDCAYAAATATVTCNTESMAPGATAQISIQAVALTEGTTINTGTVDSSTPDPNRSNNTDDDDIRVEVAVLPPVPAPAPTTTTTAPPAAQPASPEAPAPSAPAAIELPSTGIDGRSGLLAGFILLALGAGTLAVAKKRRRPQTTS